MRQMKVRFVALICLLFLQLSCAAEVKGEAVFSSDAPVQYAVGHQGVLFLQDGALLWFPENAREAMEVLRDDTIVLAAADQQEDILYYLTEADGVQTLHAVTSGGLPYGEAAPLPKGQNVVQLEADGGLYALNQRGVLYDVFPFGEVGMTELKVKGWDNQGISTFSVLDGLLAAYQPDSETLFILQLGGETTLLQSVKLPAVASVQAEKTADG